MSTASRPSREPVPGLDLRIELVRPGAGLGRIRVTGELDLATAPRLRRVLLGEIELLAREGTLRAPRLELDLSQVGFCAAAGLSVLLEARAAAAAAGVGFVLRRTSGTVGRVLVLGDLGQAHARMRGEPPRETDILFG